MFRKPKKGKKAGMRRKRSSEDSDEEVNDNSQAGEQNEAEESTFALLSEARKRTKMTGKSNAASENSSSNQPGSGSNVMHQYATSKVDARQQSADLITSTVQHHPENQKDRFQNDGKAGFGDDGIFRDKTRSKLLAGPIKVTGSIRTTARFDYQPDICKDYKETGFCGYGDTCIYLHDRGDTLTGWQLEQQWEEEQKRKKDQQEREIQGFLRNEDGSSTAESDQKKAALVTDDGLPYACHICRQAFTNPVVTSCAHYFCEKCIMQRVRTESETCPICSKDTHGVFNQPTKLIAKKRKVLGAAAASKDSSWEAFAKAFTDKSGNDEQYL